MSGWRRMPSIYPLRLSVYLFTHCLTSTMYRYNDNAPDTSPALTTNTLAALVCQSLFSPSQSLLPSSRHYHVALLRLHAFVLGYIVLLVQLQDLIQHFTGLIGRCRLAFTTVRPVGPPSSFAGYRDPRI